MDNTVREKVIETYKIVTGKTNYGTNLYIISRSEIKLLFSAQTQSAKCDFMFTLS